MALKPDIELVALTKRYGDTLAVDSIDLRIPAGSYCCLLGPSGCGKTTTLRMIAGHEEASDGDILLGSENITHLPTAARGTAMMFQSYALFPHLTVLENLTLAPMWVGKSSKAEAEERAMQQLKRVRIAEQAQKYPLQLSGGLTDGFSRLIRLPDRDRRLLLVAALGGGFGAVFGVPLAGTVFALEVQSVGRVRYEAIVPTLTAAIVGNEVVRGLGYHHHLWAPLTVHLTAWLGVRVALAGLCFGLAGAAFIELSEAIKHAMGRVVAYPPVRTAIGGVAIVGLAALVGRDYLGLSTPLIERALSGDRLSFAVFALKIVFTAITLGCAFPGGEVTPLFCIGATLGVALAAPLHLPAVLLAGIGYVAVFAGASNTPLACTVMGAELFGSGAVVPLAIGCVVAFVASGHRSIYSTQRVAVTKAGGHVAERRPIRDWWSHRR